MIIERTHLSRRSPGSSRRCWRRGAGHAGAGARSACPPARSSPGEQRGRPRWSSGNAPSPMARRSSAISRPAAPSAASRASAPRCATLHRALRALRSRRRCRSPGEPARSRCDLADHPVAPRDIALSQRRPGARWAISICRRARALPLPDHQPWQRHRPRARRTSAAPASPPLLMSAGASPPSCRTGAAMANRRARPGARRSRRNSAPTDYDRQLAARLDRESDDVLAALAAVAATARDRRRAISASWAAPSAASHAARRRQDRRLPLRGRFRRRRDELGPHARAAPAP